MVDNVNTWQTMKKMLLWLLTGNFKCGSIKCHVLGWNYSVKPCYSTFTQTIFSNALIAFETCSIFTNQVLFSKTVANFEWTEDLVSW